MNYARILLLFIAITLVSGMSLEALSRNNANDTTFDTEDTSISVQQQIINENEQALQDQSSWKNVADSSQFFVETTIGNPLRLGEFIFKSLIRGVTLPLNTDFPTNNAELILISILQTLQSILTVLGFYSAYQLIKNRGAS